MGKEYTRPVDVISNTPAFGNLIVYEDFSKGNSLTVTASGEDFIATIQSVLVFSGLSSFYMKTRYTDAAAADMVRISRRAYIKPEQLLGFDAGFRLPSVLTDPIIRFELNSTSLIGTKCCEILWYASDEKWYYADADGNYTEIDGIARPMLPHWWHHFHIVWNVASNKIKFFSINQYILECSSLVLFESLAASSVNFFFRITIEATNNQRPVMLVDNIRISTMEI